MRRAGKIQILLLAIATALIGCADQSSNPQRHPLVASPPREASGSEDPRMNPYLNNSTAPSIIRIRLRDRTSGRLCQTVAENPAFLTFALQHWAEITEEPAPLTLEDYATFMVAHEEVPIEIDLADYLQAGYAKEIFWTDLSDPCFDTPYTLAELGFGSELALIDAYFDFDHEKGSGVQRGGQDWRGAADLWEPRLIALFIDLGYTVGRGDIVPLMYISKNPLS